MSEVCPFMNEIKSRDRDPLRSLVRSRQYRKARTEHKVLSSFEDTV